LPKGKGRGLSSEKNQRWGELFVGERRDRANFQKEKRICPMIKK